MPFPIKFASQRGKTSRNATIFDDLSDDVLGNILLFCPFPSAVAFARQTCKNLRDRSPQLSHVWKVIYDRQGFFPPEEQHEQTDYLMLGNRKYHLLSNVMQKKNYNVERRHSPSVSNKNRQRIFPSVRQFSRQTWKNIRYWSRHLSPFWKAFNYRQGFVPLDGQREYSTRSGHRRERRSVPSNVVLQNQSYNAGGQQSLSLPENCFYFMPILPPLMDAEHDNYSTMMIPPPEFHDYQSFSLIGGGTSPELLLLDPFDGSLSVFKDCFRRANHFDSDTSHSSGDSFMMPNGEDGIDTVHDSRYLPFDPPIQCLFQGNEWLDVDLISGYFPNHDRGWITDDFEFCYGGIDAMPIWRECNFKSYQLDGYLVSALRCLRNLDNDSVACAEFSTWTRSMDHDATFGNRRLCRFPFIFDMAEVDACHLRVLVHFVSEIEGTNHTISVYPLIDWQGDNAGPTSTELYFPQSVFSIHCQGIIATFSLDAIGQTLLAATRCGDIEVWMLGLETGHRQQVLNLLSQPCWFIELEFTRSILGAQSDGTTEFTTFKNDRGEEFVEKPVFPAFHPSIKTILVPNHLPVQRSGFLTLHDNREDGRSLLLWKLVEDSWHVVALIHLDLAHCPRLWITYDGHRIIVFGEDHVGSIILLYQVLNSDNIANSEADCPIGEGGVYHMVNPHVVRFANRVRHPALGGMDSLDSFHMMTCNERFIVVNTRRGNRLGTSPFRDGLLVIDLDANGLRTDAVSL